MNRLFDAQLTVDVCKVQAPEESSFQNAQLDTYFEQSEKCSQDELHKSSGP